MAVDLQTSIDLVAKLNALSSAHEVLAQPQESLVE